MKKVKLYCCDKYSVDDLGNVYSKSGKVLKPTTTNQRGYFMVTLMINGSRKTLTVHRAILNSFIEPPLLLQFMNQDGLNNLDL